MGIQQIKEINLTNTNKANYLNSPLQDIASIEKEEQNSQLNDINDLDTHPVTPSCKTNRTDTRSHPTLNFRNQIKEKKIIKSNSNLVEDVESVNFELQKKRNVQFEDSNLIDQCILKHFFMQSLNKQAREEIIREMSLVFIKANTIIYSHSVSGSYFYIVKKGSVEITINEERVKVYKEGESFGEIALLHDTPRSGNAITSSDCYLWVLGRKNFKKIVNLVTKINFKENMSFIESIYILSHLEDYHKTILASSLYKVSYKKGMTIVNKGNQANCLYIIQEGEVECIQKGSSIRTLYKSDTFGERSILVDSTRTLDVIAKTDLVCFSISVTTLKAMLGPQYKTLLYLNFAKHVLHNSFLFKRFPSGLLEKVFYLFEAVNLTEDNVAFPIGHVKNSKFVIVIDGNLINAKTGVIVANRGRILFEAELLNNSTEKTLFPIDPHPDCLFLEADTDRMLALMGSSFIEIMNKSEKVKALSEVLIFNHIPKRKLEKIAESVQLKKLAKGEEMNNQVEKDKFFIIKSGTVDIFVEGIYLKTVKERDFFGEKQLFIEGVKYATAVGVENSELLSLKKDEFFANVDPVMKQYLYNCLYIQDNHIELSDLIFIKSLGVGNYGGVSLVHCKKNNYLYAVKAISRKHIDHDKLHHNLELEKSILLHLHHPFIVKLVKCLKDEKYIYFLMEYVRGKEMFDVIRDIGLLNKEQTQFFSGCLIKAIEYLHKRKLIYRDFKPENIMIKDNGFVKLIDFGTAKQITDCTSTILGTPHYMAPEIILGKGYSFPADYWSLAVCMYEFVCGNVPFGEVNGEPMDAYQAIVNQKLTFPLFVLDREFQNLMRNMLAKNPSARLTRSKAIQNHIWFSGFDWENLMSFNITPPYKPKLKTEKAKEVNIPFTEYMSSYVESWQPSRSLVISPKLQAEYDKWFMNF